MSVPSREGGQAKTGNRRVHERRLIAPRLYVILDGSNSDGILNDVSEGGAALDIVGPKPEGEYVLVDFEMSEIGQHFEAKGRITWRDETGERVGVHFVDLPEASRSRIREWLSLKSISPEPIHSAIVQDSEREGLSVQHGMLQGEPQSNRVLQALRDPFNRPGREPQVQLANTISTGRVFFPRQRLRTWIVAAAAASLAVLLAFGLGVLRLPERNAGTISVSKAGRRATTGTEGAKFKEGGTSGNGGDGGDSGNTPSNSQPSAPTLLSSLPTAGRHPCVKLGAPIDKIRIYLWLEKDTPDAIGKTYSKYLKAVLDVQVVDKAPYDLVLYVNGANVDAQGSEAGFIWSSRVFRPWYCGEALGLLEQTQVKESLHYVQGVNLDQSIQAEIAYLILHTFESLRSEHAK
jgi:hypothetical protein